MIWNQKTCSQLNELIRHIWEQLSNIKTKSYYNRVLYPFSEFMHQNSKCHIVNLWLSWDIWSINEITGPLKNWTCDDFSAKTQEQKWTFFDEKLNCLKCKINIFLGHSFHPKSLLSPQIRLLNISIASYYTICKEKSLTNFILAKICHNELALSSTNNKIIYD